MSAKNNVWKIVDTETGKFWDGYNRECSHAVGTRFERQASLDDAVKAIMRKYKGVFPPTWAVQRVTLVENVERSMDAHATRIDILIDADFATVLSARGVNRASKQGAKLFRQLRLNGDFEKWPYIGLRQPAYQSSWPTFAATMRDLSVMVKTRMKAYEDGWVMFADKDAVMAAKLADTMQQVFAVDDLREAFAKHIGVAVEDV